MTKIRPKIFLGHEYDAHMIDVHQNRIDVILNVADDLNDPIYPRKKVLTVKVGLSDDKDNTPGMIELAVMTLDHLVKQGYTILIHCRAGMSRSPYVLALYLSKVEGKPFRQVWDEIGALRPEVLDRSRLA